jgi:superfamily II DNA or RNA helicase
MYQMFKKNKETENILVKIDLFILTIKQSYDIISIMSKKVNRVKSKFSEKISDRILDIFNNHFLDNDYENIKIKHNIKKLLYNYQHLHVFNLVTCIRNNNIALDGSATGTGKTYTAIALCNQLNLDPIIVCSNSTKSYWQMVCNRFSVKPITIVNYELLRTCKIYDKDGGKIKAPFLTKEKSTYKWNIEKPKNTIIIYDEVHKCKNNKSLQGKLLMSSKHQCKILMLSATLCDKLEDFLVFGYMLGFYNKLILGKNWIKGVLRDDMKKLDKSYSSLATHLFPNKGSRMMIEDIGKDFPDNKISADCYDLDKKSTKYMNHYLEIVKDNLDNNNKLCEISLTRQKIEKLKSTIILEELLKYYEMDKSVVVFINFLETLDIISDKLNKLKIKHSIVKGGQTENDRMKNIDLFQYNKNKVILCTIQTGGESINLHDKNGTNPRVSIISPSFSSLELCQTLGRIYRSDTKSKCLQKIIFCSNTYEERICEIIKEKYNFITKLTDDDLII